MLLENVKWLEDLDSCLESNEDIKKLEGKSILITGATGLICSAVVDLFIRYNEQKVLDKNSFVKILAAGRSEEKIRIRFGIFSEKEYFTFVPYDATAEELDFSVKADYIIHGASNAFPAKIVGEPVETMLSNFSGLYNLLEYARESETSKVLYISSSEIYGNRNTSDDSLKTKPFTEDEYGFIDVLSPRSSYPISKRAAETLAVCYGAEYGIKTVIVRPGHIYGPTASRGDNRISSEFAYMAAEGVNLVMRSAGSQMRSYMHCLDTATAMLKVLVAGEGGKAYNISNPDSIISIREMAAYLAEAGGVELKFDMPDADDQLKFSAMTNASLDSSSLESLGWRGKFDAKTGLSHTVEVLKAE